MLKIYPLILFIVSLINGCTSVDYSRPEAGLPPVYEASKAEEIAQPKVITTAAVDKTHVAKVTKKSVPASRAAVLDLLTQSKAAIDKNHYDEAENLLKRALRIEPGNAWLWHNMAVIKFYQEDYRQAIQQALKSNNLGKNNQQLTKNNNKIIKQSKIELGKTGQSE